MNQVKTSNPRFAIIQSISDIPPEQWDCCANPPVNATSAPRPYHPFVSHAFLSSLEESGSVGPGTGWTPSHQVAFNSNQELIGAVPMYIKDHSHGEYVFDFQWADAFEQAGGSYYPKLQVSVPFTPVTGPRILVKPSDDEKDIELALIRKSVEIAEETNLSSLHFTFLQEEQMNRLSEYGFLKRIDQQFRWQNKGYTSFKDFLDQLSAKKRKNIRRERRIALENGITIETFSGSELREHHWDAFFRFYMDTGSRKWGSPYLNRPFFSLLGEKMADRVLLVMCRLNENYVAGALNLIGGETLYGRYWGSIDYFPCLHFEVCYYQAIEYAIRNQLKYVEAGAQGEHKLARGYLSAKTYSAHWITHPAFRQALMKFLLDERQYVNHHITFLNGHSPFKEN